MQKSNPLHKRLLGKMKSNNFDCVNYKVGQSHHILKQKLKMMVFCYKYFKFN